MSCPPSMTAMYFSGKASAISFCRTAVHAGVFELVFMTAVFPPAIAAARGPSVSVKGKLKGLADQKDRPVGHLIDFCRRAREADDAACVSLRTAPAGKSGNHFVDLKNDCADIAEISLRFRPAEIFAESSENFIFVITHSLPKPFQPADPPCGVECFSASKKGVLATDDFLYAFCGEGRTFSCSSVRIHAERFFIPGCVQFHYKVYGAVL